MTTPETDEQVIARHILAALRDALGLTGSVLDYPDEVITTAAIVAAECSAELEGRAAQNRLRICIDADCPNCGWGERWAETTPPVFGCNECTYRSSERDR